MISLTKELQSTTSPTTWGGLITGQCLKVLSWRWYRTGWQEFFNPITTQAFHPQQTVCEQYKSEWILIVLFVVFKTGSHFVRGQILTDTADMSMYCSQWQKWKRLSYVPEHRRILSVPQCTRSDISFETPSCSNDVQPRTAALWASPEKDQNWCGIFLCYDFSNVFHVVVMLMMSYWR